MPQFGLGLFIIPDGKVTYNSVRVALRSGYRHFYPAYAYRNERSVGKAIRESEVPRKRAGSPRSYGQMNTAKAKYWPPLTGCSDVSV